MMRWKTHHKLFYLSWDFRRVYRKWRRGLGESRIVAFKEAWSLARLGWTNEVWLKFRDSEDVMRGEMARYAAVIGWLVAGAAVLWRLG